MSAPVELALCTQAKIASVDAEIQASTPTAEALAQSYSNALNSLFAQLQAHIAINYTAVHGNMSVVDDVYSYWNPSTPPFILPLLRVAGDSSIQFVYKGTVYFLPCSIYSDGYGTHVP